MIQPGLVYKNTMNDLRISIIGTGRVGSALTLAFVKCGLPLISFHDLIPEKIEAIQNLLTPMGISPSTSLQDMRSANIIILAVQDQAIESTARALLAPNLLSAGSIVVHTSGSQTLNCLKMFRSSDFEIGSIHPFYAFSGGGIMLTGFQDVCFGIDGSEHVRMVLNKIVSCIGGFSVHITDENRSLYHAAAVVASNFLPALQLAANDLMIRCGVSSTNAAKSVHRIQQSALDNLKTVALSEAITGPLVRGDLNTVNSHIQTLSEDFPRYLPAYIALSEILTDQLLQNSQIDQILGDALRSLFDSAKRSGIEP